LTIRRGKMKKYLCLIFAIAVIDFLPTLAIGSDYAKFGVVDIQRCISESIEGKRVFQELQGKKDAMQEKLDRKQNELLSLKDELEKQSMMLSVDAKEDKKKDFERKGREFKFLYEDLSEEMREAETEARNEILKELEEVVSDIGKRDNYLLIFERRTSGIMYLDKKVDITDDAVEAYDRKKKGENK
jgi:outer membrane protein